MAFSKAPSQDTYQSKEIKLIEAMGSRTNSLEKDPILTNGFYEVLSNKTTKDENYHAVKRDGCSVFSYIPESANIRGMHYWKDQNKLYIAYDTFLDVVNVSTGVRLVHAARFAAGTTPVAFTEFADSTGWTGIVFGDGITLHSIHVSDAMAALTDPDLPTPYLPYLVALDGYIFLVKAGTSDIYNSDLDQPAGWTPGNFISAEMIPDALKGIARLNNYLIAFGSDSVEYFFDAGNASGSPLQRNDTPVKRVGFLGGFVTHGNKVFFVGQYANTTPELFILEDFKMDEVNLPQLRRYMEKDTEFSAAIVSNGGHDFYILTVNNESFALDLDTKLWAVWKFQGEDSFPISYSALLKETTSFASIVAVTGKTNLYKFSPTLYQDAGTNFDFEGVIGRNFFDTHRQKFMHRLFVLADKINTTVNMSYSDDDYQTFSTERSVSLNQERPVLHQLGKFYSRIFKWRHTDNTPCRLFGLEVDFNIGGR